jgi:hypothetical protein
MRETDRPGGCGEVRDGEDGRKSAEAESREQEEMVDAEAARRPAKCDGARHWSDD